MAARDRFEICSGFEIDQLPDGLLLRSTQILGVKPSYVAIADWYLMPSKPKRPRDPNQLAKAIVDFATCEAEEFPAVDAKKAKAGRRGAKARKRALNPEQRSEIASIAAQSRWEKR
jgi:hypothetical protein